ncbi:MAG: hypothetical protein E6J91_16290 [Deltaproteobacteria bacterium]|nr:MAG: hypothetical protein E6J91_16290 [Deltaproteobacteria bacterium]
MSARSFALTPGKRVLYLTKDPDKIRQQLAGRLTLTMNDVAPADLLDDINTDVMTPAWVCFDHDPAEIAKNAYAGLIVGGQRLIPPSALRDGGFEVIVAGAQKGVGSSRETAAQCEVFSGSRLAIASSFAPIHARNNINIGQLMGDHDMLRRLERGESIPLAEFTAGHDAITALIIESGGLLPFCARLARKEIAVPPTGTAPRPMNLTEKILAAKLLPGQGSHVKPGDAVLVKVDAGYSHEFTTAQVDKFLVDEYGAGYRLADPARFAVFEDHLIYATGVAAMAKYADKIEQLRALQRRFAAATGVRNYSAVDGVSPGICHQVAREQLIDPGDFIQATDSHTCMGGASGALAWGVGATEYAALIYWGVTPIAVPESIRFELTGRLPPGTSAKDVMLHILATYAKREDTLNRVMEFGGDGLFALSPDERATLANMATECSARGAVMEVDDTMLRWIAERRGGDPARRHPRSRRAPRRRRPPHRPRPDPPHGRHPRRPRPRHRQRPQERRPHPRDRPRRDRHRLRRLVHRRQARRHRHVRAGHGRGRARRQARRRRRPVLHPVRLAGSRGLRPRARLHRPVRAHRRPGHQARLRRLHRLRPRRQRSPRSGHRLRDQPQLQGPLRPRPPLPRLPAHRRRLRRHRQDSRVPRRHVRHANLMSQGRGREQLTSPARSAGLREAAPAAVRVAPAGERP